MKIVIVILLCLHFQADLVHLQNTRQRYFAPFTTDCKLTRSGREYAGSLNVTQTGLTCQAWSKDEPQVNYYKHLTTEFPEGSAAAAGNRCRNPDVNYNDGVWCYTTSLNMRWDHCDIRFCECKLPNDMLGIRYEGEISFTRSGRTCRRWIQQTPTSHPFNSSEYFPDPTVSQASNYCRNPNASRPEGPWCYTTDSNVEWEYCLVPVCNLTSPVFSRPVTTRQSSTVLGWTSSRPIQVQTSATTSRTTASTKRTPSTVSIFRSSSSSSSSSNSSRSSILRSSSSSGSSSSRPISSSSIFRSSSSISSSSRRGSSSSSSSSSSSNSNSRSNTNSGGSSSWISPIPSQKQTTRTSASFTEEISSQAVYSSNENTSGTVVLKVVLPILGLIGIACIVAAIIVWKRQCADFCKKPWERFNSSSRDPAEAENNKRATQAQATNDAEPPYNIRANESDGFDNPAYRNQQPTMPVLGVTKGHSSTDFVNINDSDSVAYVSMSK